VYVDLVSARAHHLHVLPLPTLTADEFKPPSIEGVKTGLVEKSDKNEVRVELSDDGSGNSAAAPALFRGKCVPAKPTECVLLFDGKQFILERLHSNVQNLRLVRAARAPSSAPSPIVVKKPIPSAAKKEKEKEQEAERQRKKNGKQRLKGEKQEEKQQLRSIAAAEKEAKQSGQKRPRRRPTNSVPDEPNSVRAVDREGLLSARGIPDHARSTKKAKTDLAAAVAEHVRKTVLAANVQPTNLSIVTDAPAPASSSTEAPSLIEQMKNDVLAEMEESDSDDSDGSTDLMEKEILQKMEEQQNAEQEAATHRVMGTQLEVATSSSSSDESD
jgi:hypothetical protein